MCRQYRRRRYIPLLISGSAAIRQPSFAPWGSRQPSTGAGDDFSGRPEPTQRIERSCELRANGGRDLVAHVARTNADLFHSLDVAHESILVFNAVAFLGAFRWNVFECARLDLGEDESRFLIGEHGTRQSRKTLEIFERRGARDPGGCRDSRE